MPLGKKISALPSEKVKYLQNSSVDQFEPISNKFVQNQTILKNFRQDRRISDKFREVQTNLETNKLEAIF